VSVGASGGVFALVGAFGVAVWRLRFPLLADTRRRLLVVLAVMVGVDFMIGFCEPLVDELAHVIGFAAGTALAWVVRWRAQPAGQMDDS
jgi:membrane associated rhomboid family serine protease